MKKILGDEAHVICLDQIEEKTKINTEVMSYISPLWTYKLLTFLSVLMITGELFAFLH